MWKAEGHEAEVDADGMVEWFIELVSDTGKRERIDGGSYFIGNNPDGDNFNEAFAAAVDYAEQRNKHKITEDDEMTNNITLRLVVMKDAKTLLEWRNDESTRSASHNTEMIKMDDHVAWLSATLNNPNRQLFIAEDDGHPIGTVRADFSDGIHELSWTIAPSMRGRGLAKIMVSILANQINTPIRAEVKEENIASIKVAEYAGMTIDRNDDGVIHLMRGNKPYQC